MSHAVVHPIAHPLVQHVVVTRAGDGFLDEQGCIALALSDAGDHSFGTS